MRTTVFLTLLALWLTLSGMYDSFHISLGVASSLLVTLWSGGLWRQDSAQGFIRGLLSLVWYGPWLLWQIVLSNIHVMKLVFHPRLTAVLQPTIVCFSANELDNDWARYMLANSITLTPGTVTVMVSPDGRYLCHAISKDAAAGLPQPMLEKVQKAFNVTGRRRVP